MTEATTSATSRVAQVVACGFGFQNDSLRCAVTLRSIAMSHRVFSLSLCLSLVVLGPSHVRAQGLDKSTVVTAVAEPDKASTPSFASSVLRIQQPAPSGLKQQKMRSGLYKLIAGGALVTVGALLAATSGAHAEICVNEPFLGRVCSTVDARSDGQLWGGVGVAGAGGVLLWLGAKDRSDAAALPSRTVSFVPSRRGLRFVYTQIW